jgi:EAL domain-containing protein (putative c-di-GMP-specific phosphodiesterase class I)
MVVGAANAVLGLALAQARRWRDDGLLLTVAVNLSVTNLLDADLPAEVGRLLVAHDLPADTLTLEITESVLMADSARANLVVQQLHALGVGLSIDDYGTGYCSLAYLHDLPVDELKLDKIFVERLPRNPRSAAIVRSTIDLAHSLGLKVVAEGVEDAVTVELLQRLGCDISQGYLHSRPLPGNAFASWLAAREQSGPAEQLVAQRGHLEGEAVGGVGGVVSRQRRDPLEPIGQRADRQM